MAAPVNVTWNGAAPPPLPRPTLAQRAGMMARGAALLFMTYFLMIFVLLFQFIERFWKIGVAHRIIRLWGKLNLRLCGVRLRRVGEPMPHGGAIVANHIGWIDIFTMLSADRLFFVSKAEVARWPVVGILSRQIDPVYIERRRTASRAQEDMLKARLARGDRLCFFPEGTSTDGQRVLQFKSTLFSVFLTEDLRETLWVQPVSLAYRPADHLPRSFYGWWGDMGLGAHLAAVFSLSRGGEVHAVFHPPLRARDFADRKALAAACEAAVRAGLEERLLPPQ